MRRTTVRQAGLAATAVAALLVTTPQLASATARHTPLAVSRLTATNAVKAAADTGGDGEDESHNSLVATEEWTEARTAPGIVAPGAYGAAFTALKNLPATTGSYTHVTRKVYNADDPRYRDYASNSSGGAGNVTGRTTGLASDRDGYVYAAGANGGVWRSSTGGGHWTPIADSLPSLSSGDLELDSTGRLWYATGEANTGATSFVGAGVFVDSSPRTSPFSVSGRVGGDELESTIINALRFAPGIVYAATSSGVWTHSTTTLSGAWTRIFAPNPDYLAGGPLASDPTAAYKNIANDVAIDPRDPSKVVLALGWRGGDAYNGFYRQNPGSSAWVRFNPKGAIPQNDIGNVSFAYAADGSKLYAINESIRAYFYNPNTALGGVYVSANGSPFGPWTLIADSTKLKDSGSALQDPGYQPGIQAWYNQSLRVDPADPQHLLVGLEEVFESRDGGATWKTVGPYWNFGFPCWSIDPTKQTGDCPQTTHPDQHSASFGFYGGQAWEYVGNDGGIYRRPVDGATNADGHATDWVSLNDGTIDALQYYSVGVGTDPAGGGMAVSGGLQDNGQSILRANDKVMGSNFGGDGGDTLVDPNNGCNIVAEYVYLAMRVTNNCNANQGDGSPQQSTSRDIDPLDPSPRFIAPMSPDTKNIKTWVAGGEFVYVQTHGFAIQTAAEWNPVFDLGAGHSATSISVSGGKAYVGWCGPCNSPGFVRGIAVGNTDGTGWSQLTLPADGSVLPNRYVAGGAVDPTNPNHAFVAFSGFSRAWTEGPGAGIGHVFETKDAGATWKDVSANLPDIPTNHLALTAGGSLIAGTDLGVVVRPAGSTKWSRLGTNFPTTTVTDVEVSANGLLYVATHGRGIWSTRLGRLA